jgi:large subunit ribosomal protein L3
LLGFAGYKAGMTHVFMIDDKPGSPEYGKEVLRATTIVETPSILVCAVRAYIRDHDGLRTFSEFWMKNPPRDLLRVISFSEEKDFKHNLKMINENLNNIVEFRVIVSTRPQQAQIPKKKPDLMEVKIGGGTIKEQFDYAKDSVGKTVPISDVFQEGQFVDVTSVTKGKGFQGPVKRWGVKILPRKSRKTKRGVAVIGAWHPARVLYTVPRAGQMGYFRRTEYNKRILKMGTDGKEVSPKGGFIRYGPIKGVYTLFDGSIPGPTKRLIRLRFPARPPKRIPETAPTITYVSTESPQGK